MVPDVAHRIMVNRETFVAGFAVSKLVTIYRLYGHVAKPEPNQ